MLGDAIEHSASYDRYDRYDRYERYDRTGDSSPFGASLKLSNGVMKSSLQSRGSCVQAGGIPDGL